MAQTNEPESRLLAWDGVSFKVPANWELALYTFEKKGPVHIEVEDEYAVRIEGQWLRAHEPFKTRDALKRYEKNIYGTTRLADHKEVVQGLPKGWMATIYRFREGVLTKDIPSPMQENQGLVTAFYESDDRKFFCYLLMHFTPEDPENPPEIVRMLTKSFTVHNTKVIPWALFDMQFETPREWELELTRFDIGAKLMAFRWRFRRFYLWHFSIASQFMQGDETPEEWFSAHLNGRYLLKGRRFYPVGDGEVVQRRKRIHFLGHSDEISRWCFKWKIRCKLDPERDMLIGWVYNYRKQDDLKMIPESLRFGRSIFKENSPPDPKWLEKKKRRMPKS